MRGRNNSKKILLVSCRFYPPKEGGEQAIFEQIQYLLSKGYSCTSLHFRTWDGKRFTSKKTFWRNGIKIIQSPKENSSNVIEETIIQEDPAIVYTCSFPAPLTLSIAKKMGKKTVLGTHAISEIHDIYTGRCTSYEHRRKRAPRRAFSVLRLADVIITSSTFGRESIRKHLRNIQNPPVVKVVHPIPPREKVKAKTAKRCYISTLSSSEAKGIFMVMALAGSMPQYSFLVAGDASLEDRRNTYAAAMLKKFKNIKVIPFRKDTSSIYGMTKILLIPSLLDETFSRVAWEAMSNGIPVIASNKGNLPALVSKGGYTLDPRDTAQWRKRILKLMTDPKAYKSKSCQACRLSKRYDYYKEMKRVSSILGQLLTRAPERARTRPSKK